MAITATPRPPRAANNGVMPLAVGATAVGSAGSTATSACLPGSRLVAGQHMAHRAHTRFAFDGAKVIGQQVCATWARMGTVPIRAHGVPKKLGPARWQAPGVVGGEEEDRTSKSSTCTKALQIKHLQESDARSRYADSTTLLDYNLDHQHGQCMHGIRRLCSTAQRWRCMQRSTFQPSPMTTKLLARTIAREAVGTSRRCGRQSNLLVGRQLSGGEAVELAVAGRPILLKNSMHSVRSTSSGVLSPFP